MAFSVLLKHRSLLISISNCTDICFRACKMWILWHSYKILMIQEGKPFYLTVLSKPCSDPEKCNFIMMYHDALHSHKILSIQQGKPCYLSILSNPRSDQEESQAGIPRVKPCWCLPRISNGTNSPGLALLYCRNFMRVYNNISEGVCTNTN